MYLGDPGSLALCALSLQVLLLPLSTEGLTCFECNSKLDHGCTNDQLKAGHTNPRFSKTCHGKDPVCVKASITVSGYYEAVFSGKALTKYFASVKKHSDCLAAAQAAADGVTKPPGGEVATTASAVGGSGGSTGAGSGAGNAAGTVAPGVGTTAIGGTTGVASRGKRSAVDYMAGGKNGRLHFSIGGLLSCPDPIPFPSETGYVEKHEYRTKYTCGNRSDYQRLGVHERCRKTSDSVVMQKLCTCSSDLCNGSPRLASVSAAFALLAAALLHLHPVVG